MEIENPAFLGAGDGNRTHVFSLEGCCTTIVLRPHFTFQQGSAGIIHYFFPFVKRDSFCVSPLFEEFTFVIVIQRKNNNTINTLASIVDYTRHTPIDNTTFFIKSHNFIAI